MTGHARDSPGGLVERDSYRHLVESADSVLYGGSGRDRYPTTWTGRPEITRPTPAPGPDTERVRVADEDPKVFVATRRIV